MDGLLIDSEPLWEEAAAEVLQEFNITLTPKQYHHTTGLRTREWLTYWFHYFKINNRFTERAIEMIIKKAIAKIEKNGIAMPGVPEAFHFFNEHQYKIGLATSSPMAVVDVVVDKLKIRHSLQAMTSAEHLQYGKPHPEVYLTCAAALQSAPLQCICFEDSFNGMIAAKAAHMKCVVIPAPDFRNHGKWNAADMQLNSLLEFGYAQLKQLR